MIVPLHRLLLLLFLLTVTYPVFSQSSQVETPRFIAHSFSGTTDSLPVGDRMDSLFTRRMVLATALYEKGNRLTKAAIRSKLASTPASWKANRMGEVLRPVGALVGASGLVVGYLGIKGKETTAMVRGIRTPGGPSVPDVAVNYTERSLPMVLGGLGLVVGGLCLIELSNELTVKSVRLYNTKVSQQNALSQSVTLKFGITLSGSLGLEAHF
jgi:hypothetical protein